MRSFFLGYLLAWLAGIAVGVAGAHFAGGLLTGVLAGLAAFLHRRRSPQQAAAAAALSWLGFVWALSGAQASVAACAVAEPMEARVTERVEIQARRLRLVVEAAGHCRVLVLAPRFNDVREGDLVRLAGGTVQPLDSIKESLPSYARYLERRGITAVWRYPQLTVTQQGNSWTAAWRENVRARVNTLFIEPDASLVLALLFAEQGTLPASMVEHFRATGVSHVLSISGLHISLLAGMFVGLMLLLPVGPRARTLFTLIILWLYIVYIGAPASAVRAASFWTVALAALRLQLLVSLPAVLLLASSVLITLRPPYLADIGFQLSVAGVIGIFLALFLSRTLLLRFTELRRWLLLPLLVSAGATLTTAPIVAYHFGNVALASIAANLLVVPFVPVLLSVSLAALVLSELWLPPALLASYIMHGVVVWLDSVTSFIAVIPGHFLEEVDVPPWFLPAYYAALAVMSIAVMRVQRRSWRELWD